MRRPLLRRRVIAFAIATAFVSLLAAWMAGGALVAPAGRPIGPPPVDLPIEAVTFVSESRSRIAGWLVDTPEASASVVLVHPLRADRRAMLGRARELHGEGYRVLLIDLQAHGESPGEAITMGWRERHDIAAAIGYVRERWPAGRIGVVGWSLGGAAAVLASPLGIDALVLESVYPTLGEAVHNRLALRVGRLANGIAPLLVWQVPLRLGIDVESLRPIDRMPRIDCPVLLLAGEKDRRTTVEESRRMAAAAEQSELILFPEVGHVDLFAYDRTRWRSAVCPFLRSRLAADSVGRLGVSGKGD